MKIHYLWLYTTLCEYRPDTNFNTGGNKGDMYKKHTFLQLVELYDMENTFNTDGIQLQKMYLLH